MHVALAACPVTASDETTPSELDDELRPEYDRANCSKGGVRGKYVEMDVEEEYLDILQNIEFAIMSVYRENPLLVDFDVEAAINALISLYHAAGAESRGAAEPT